MLFKGGILLFGLSSTGPRHCNQKSELRTKQLKNMEGGGGREWRARPHWPARRTGRYDHSSRGRASYLVTLLSGTGLPLTAKGCASMKPRPVCYIAARGRCWISAEQIR